MPAKSRSARAKTGRPTKLTPALQAKICDALRAGNYMEIAAAFAGIDRTTVYAWLRKGARARSGIYAAFSWAVEKAMADAEARDVALIAKAAAEHWQAAAWRLERRYPDRYARPAQRVIHETSDNESGGLDLTRLTDEELDLLDRLTAKAAVTEPAPGDLTEPPGSAQRRKSA